jgi:hypothetical protein
MATMIDGESYVGRVLMRPLSPSGDLRLYLWPLRCLKSRMGGPTFGIEVKGEEIGKFHAPDDSSLKLCSSPLMVDVV